jgi:hypothetical protein
MFILAEHMDTAENSRGDRRSIADPVDRNQFATADLIIPCDHAPAFGLREGNRKSITIRDGICRYDAVQVRHIDMNDEWEGTGEN